MEMSLEEKVTAVQYQLVEIINVVKSLQKVVGNMQDREDARLKKREAALEKAG